MTRDFFLRPAVAAILAATLFGCGGGGGDTGPASTDSSAVLPASQTLAEQCVAPRPAGTVDPATGTLYLDSQGSLNTEKAFLRSWLDETYLWYSDVRALPAATLDASRYATPLSYFAALKTPLDDAAGEAKDKFHFTYDTVVWNNLSLADVSYGYGFEVALVASSPPRKAVVAYLTNAASSSAAALNNIGRGANILNVDGVDVQNGSDVATLNAGLFPKAAVPHTFVIQDLGASTSRTVVLNAQQMTSEPVQNVKTLDAAGVTVGYMQFNDHTASSETALAAAIAQLQAAHVADLVLDIRYNGGGYLDIASELAYMIGGANTNGKVFERDLYNNRNPFGLSGAQATVDFHSTAQGFSVPPGLTLPTLGLSRVYVLTSADTCSASEAIINGLRGAGVAVNLIGGQTCGKPYGFFPKDNCGTTYFAIQFQGVNDVGFGDYPDGFAPTCDVADDFSHSLGDPVEAQLNMALGLRAGGTCSPLAAVGPRALALNGARGQSAKHLPVLVRNPFRENRILRGQSRSSLRFQTG